MLDPIFQTFVAFFASVLQLGFDFALNVYGRILTDDLAASVAASAAEQGLLCGG